MIDMTGCIGSHTHPSVDQVAKAAIPAETAQCLNGHNSTPPVLQQLVEHQAVPIGHHIHTRGIHPTRMLKVTMSKTTIGMTTTMIAARIVVAADDVLVVLIINLC